MSTLQNLIASASDITNSPSASRVTNRNTLTGKVKVLPEKTRVGKTGYVVSSQLKTDIIPTKASFYKLGDISRPINKLFVDEIYVKSNGIKILDSKKVSADRNNISQMGSIQYDRTIDETRFLINEQNAKVSSASLDLKNNPINQERFNIVIQSSSFGFGFINKRTNSLSPTRLISASFATYPFIFTTSSLSGGVAVHSSGSDIQIQTSNTGSVSKFVQAFNAFHSVSSSVFPLTASIESSSTAPFSESVVRLTSTITGNRKFGID